MATTPGTMNPGISSLDWLNSLGSNHGIPKELFDRIDKNGLFDGEYSPFLVRELDPWTKQQHFQYQLPNGFIAPNANIWTQLLNGQMQYTHLGQPATAPQASTPSISPAATQALSSSQNAAGGAQRTTGGGSAPFGSPSGSGAIWSAGTGGSPAVLGGGQQRVNPFAGLFGGGGVGGGVQPPAVSSPGGGQTQPPGVPSSGGQNPYILPRESPYTPGYNIPQTPRQSSTFGGNVPGAGQFMYNPTTQGIGGNPVLAMLQNVLGLRSSMNRPALNLGAAQRPPNMQNILGSNYQTTRTPAGYTRWQQGG